MLLSSARNLLTPPFWSSTITTLARCARSRAHAMNPNPWLYAIGFMSGCGTAENWW